MKPQSRLLTCAIGAVFALALWPGVGVAQTTGVSCTSLQMLRHECGKQQADKAKHGATESKSKYPHATRKQPEVKPLSASVAKTLNEGLTAANNGDSATAQKDLQPIADSSDNHYAKALAMLGLAQAKYRGGDTKGAIALQKQALDSNALDNDNYFQGLETLAQMYIADEDYNDALATLDSWSKQSGAQSADIEALKGNTYYRLQKYPEAVAAIRKAKSLTDKPQKSWDQLEMASYFAMDKYDEAAKLAEAALAKDPNNSTLLQNVIAIYINAHQNQKALALLERARANGQINDATGYMNMARMYDNLGQTSSDPKPNALKAVAVLKEGMDKGILPAAHDTYMLLGNSYKIAGDYKNAAAAFAKAVPDANNGDAEFAHGEMLELLGQHKSARDAIQKAIDKGGLKHTGAAYLILGNAQLALKNRSAAIAAYKQAEQYPEAQAGARRVLKQMGQK